MSTELKDALESAAQAAMEDFEGRYAINVIDPVAQRVTRRRKSVRVGAGLASFVAIVCVLWTADAFADSQVKTVDPATPTSRSSNAPTDPRPDVEVPTDSWTTL